MSGQIDGTLQGDANTILVSSLSGLQFNGAPAPALPFMDSALNFYFGVPAPPVLSLDGSVFDFIACADVSCGEGFTFVPAGIFPFPLFASGPSYGAASEAYNAANWSISAVPEPSSWAMLIAGFGLVGAVARRRRPAVARAG